MNFTTQNIAGGHFSDENRGVRTRINAEVLNLAHLAQYTSNDAALERELLGLFKDQAILQFENIEQASCQDDWVMAVHTLKGSARSIGAGQVADLTAQLETVSFAGPDADKQAVTGTLKQALALCIVAVDSLL